MDAGGGGPGVPGGRNRTLTGRMQTRTAPALDGGNGSVAGTALWLQTQPGGANVGANRARYIDRADQSAIG
jgi:hypothetical protein